MNQRRRELIQTLKAAFPQPISDRMHDAYTAFSVLRALDQVDALKSQAPMLGRPVDPDWPAARQARIAETGLSLEQVVPKLVAHLEGMFVFGHANSQLNVVTAPTIASLIGVLLPAIYNPNLVSEESSRGIAQAEVEVAAMTADLVGYDPERAGGLFTFGGTGALLYGAKIGLEKACPGALETGLAEQSPVIVASTHGHYACLNAAGWLGIGQRNVIKVPSAPDNSMRIDGLRETLYATVKEGKRIACIVATMGTTDAFGIDDLASICKLRDELVSKFSLDYTPHIHADAVIGWAWSVFNTYDFRANPLDFRGRTLRALAAAQYRIRSLHLADTIGIDFHKTGYAPYVSSMVLVRDREEWKRIGRNRDLMPYLFQSGQYHPGMYSLETTRSGVGPMAALANLLLFGKEGLQVLLGNAVEAAEALREAIESHPYLTVLNGENVGPVTLIRGYPDDVDTFTVKTQEVHDPDYGETLLSHNEYNRKIFERINSEALAGRGVMLSLTDCCRESDAGRPINAIKSYILSPFTDEEQVLTVYRCIAEAREHIKNA